METKQFVDLVERAYMALHSNENTMIEVTYDPDPNDPSAAPRTCLALLVNAGEHMAEITAKAMHLLWEDVQTEDDAEIDEAMNDFVTLMGAMRVAPYMQWHAAYFPFTSAGLEDDGSFEQLAAEFENLGSKVHREYSGRAMMGKTCLGISGSATQNAEAWSTVLAGVTDEDVRQKLNQFVMDDLGHDEIMYFPQITKEQ